MTDIFEVLKTWWGYSKFRPVQEDIIRSVIEGNDTLALLPTGGGKSLCFQVPGMAMDGLCLVISPLIALMKDQEENLKKRGIRAAAIVSGMKKEEVEVVIGNCIYGNYKFLYVSPERLESEYFREHLLQMKLCMIAVDEAHCISQWGYDFRPPYLRIADLRESFPEVPVIALTASATPEVRKDICDKLKFKKPKVFVKSFARSNLSYIVRHDDNKQKRMLTVLRSVPGTGIIYVRSRKRTADTASWLMKNGITADFYHAGLDPVTRAAKQQKWMNGEIRIIVSTNAFGMGIDKPDVRSVIHIDLPNDLESYYQEAGRAGRDEKPAYAVVIYSESDLADLDRKSETGFPSKDQIVKVYNHIGNYLQIPIGSGEDVTHEFDIVDFCSQYKLDPVTTFNCMKILESEGYIMLSESFYMPPRIHISISNMDLYKFQVENKLYDHLIKTILRSYAGVFDDYVNFNESELSKRAGISNDEMQRQLKKLQELEVIRYLPSGSKPRLTTIISRVDGKHLRISKENLENRKNRFIVRAQAFRRFVTDKYHCRSMMLLQYFGEDNLQRCGTCDYCRDRNRLELNDLEYAEITSAILSAIKESPLLPHQITEAVSSYPHKKITDVMRFLLDKEDLITDSLGRITVKGGIR